jgi:hypothetical protein
VCAELWVLALLRRGGKGKGGRGRSWMQMFGEGSSGAGVGTTGLVPTRFVWPHGGRRVYLCGDFTRFFFLKN